MPHSVTCENCTLGNICITNGLSKVEVETLGFIVVRNTIVQRGAVLYGAGKPFKGLFALR